MMEIVHRVLENNAQNVLGSKHYGSMLLATQYDLVVALPRVNSTVLFKQKELALMVIVDQIALDNVHIVDGSNNGIANVKVRY